MLLSVLLVLVLVLVAWRLPLVCRFKVLLQPERDSEWLGHEAKVRRM